MYSIEHFDPSNLPALSSKDTQFSVWCLYEKTYSDFQNKVLTVFGRKDFRGNNLLFPAKVCLEYDVIVLILTIYTIQDFYSELPADFIDSLFDEFEGTSEKLCRVLSAEMYNGEADFRKSAYMNSVMDYIEDCYSNAITPKYDIDIGLPANTSSTFAKILRFMYNHFVFFLYSDRYKITSSTIYPPLSAELISKTRSVYNSIIKQAVDYLRDLMLYLRDGQIPNDN